uniref:UNC93-like protein MFSD11 n=1 Tax=Hydra vulgaris TaxID=6087 RepID=T2MJ12_HYDVU
MADKDSLRLYNVVLNGVCFMLIFTAFNTSGNIQTAALNNVERHGEKIFTNTGYISLAIIYVVFSLANFIAPPFIQLFGPKFAMVSGALTYCLFIASIIYPFVATLYIASILLGVGAAILWCGQGNFLTINSDAETISRNSSIFWALLQCSMLFGNIFVYFFLAQAKSISNIKREVLYTVLTVCAVLGTLALLFLRAPPESKIETESVGGSDDGSTDPVVSKHESSQPSNIQPTPLQVFFGSFRLLFTKDMLLLSVTASYTGFELAFYSGVYGTSISNTSNLNESHRQVGLMGILVGCGEILGGLLFSIFSKHTKKYGRNPIVLSGFIIHIIAFYLIFLNVPDRATLEPTNGDSFLNYNLYVYGLCAFFLGFGDSCFNTQMYTILGTAYVNDSASAFALFKCLQSLCSGIAFAYGLVLTLKWQLLILVITAFFGTVSFIIVERKQESLKNICYTNLS